MSTMESEYNALSTSMKDLIPIRRLFQTVSKAIGLSESINSTFKTTVWEDNMGCLRLAQLKPGQYTPRSKHYSVKYHWFRSHLHSDEPNRTVIQHITTDKQKADIMTKGLVLDKYRKCRFLLSGW